MWLPKTDCILGISIKKDKDSFIICIYILTEVFFEVDSKYSYNLFLHFLAVTCSFRVMKR